EEIAKKLDAKFLRTSLSFISVALIYFIFHEINLFARFNLRIILAFSLASLIYIFIKKRMLKEDYKVSLFVMAPLGFLLTILFKVNFIGFIILLFPLTIIYFSLRNYNDLLEEVRGTLKNLAILVDKKEPMALHHSTRVALFSQKTAEELLLSKEEIESIYNAALIHDLGKISIDDDTLAKSAPLTFDEYERIKKHPLTGARIASALNLYKDEALIVKYHHEKYDGSGYPEKLKGEAIPIGSRIIAVAETFETLISPRSYKKVSTHKEALEIIKNESGKHFDPKIVAAFLRVYEKGLIK
ncbi:MAG: HD domain-containing protein, partial [Armatimonadetes bacterium]|nr:HD domain-containing protein [Armatimonadota bacterium]